LNQNNFPISPSDKILQTGVKIQEVLQKYETVIVQNQVVAPKAPMSQKDLLSELIDVEPNKSDCDPSVSSTLGDLNDVFGRLENGSSAAVACKSDLLTPVSAVGALSFDSNALVDLMDNASGKSQTNVLSSTTFQ
jgi:hypothetical protein